jgi:hypothetical protein
VSPLIQVVLAAVDSFELTVKVPGSIEARKYIFTTRVGRDRFVRHVRQVHGRRVKLEFRDPPMVRS